MLPLEFRRASRNQSLRDLCLHMWVDVVVVGVVVVVAAAARYFFYLYGLHNKWSTYSRNTRCSAV